MSLAFALATGCIGGGPHGDEAANDEAKAQPALAVPAAAEAKPEFVLAGEGAVDEVVQAAAALATEQGRTLVVYVGATWCEPCQAFHQAVEHGQLDEPLATVRFLEFDSDRDTQRLRLAGYAGRYIPRFVLPAPDGRSSEHRIEGGIKGDGAVAHIMERLLPLLARAG